MLIKDNVPVGCCSGCHGTFSVYGITTCGIIIARRYVMKEKLCVSGRVKGEESNTTIGYALAFRRKRYTNAMVITYCVFPYMIGEYD